MSRRTILIATRGSELALAQANIVLGLCREKLPQYDFELKIVKTTGDKLQTASLPQPGKSLPRGLFTKELEIDLLNRSADLAVHSLKDLPTTLPDGLILGGVAGAREDVRDALIYRGEIKPGTKTSDLPKGLTIATSSTRRKAQMLALRPDFKAIEIRGNVPTRIKKLAEQKEMDATILAVAGLSRLKYRITPEGRLIGDKLPKDLGVTILDTSEMLPCVGQGAIGLEIRENDQELAEVCAQLNDEPTFQSVTAERALLRAMGGGCQTPIGAYARIEGREIFLSAVSFLTDKPRRAEDRAPASEAIQLGERIASRIK